MNPTEKFISKIDFFLKLIPSRFIKTSILPNFKSATIEISVPDSDDTIKISTEQSLIVINYKNNVKNFSCNIFNYNGQIDDAVSYVAFLSPKDNIRQPTLLAHQFALTFSEQDTGIILCTETMLKRIGWGHTYMTFDSKESAIDYAKNIIKDKYIECTLYNNKYEYLQTITGQTSMTS